MTKIELLGLPCLACPNRRDARSTVSRTAAREWFGYVAASEPIAADPTNGVLLCQACYERIRKAARRDAALLRDYAATR